MHVQRRRIACLLRPSPHCTSLHSERCSSCAGEVLDETREAVQSHDALEWAPLHGFFLRTARKSETDTCREVDEFLVVGVETHIQHES